MKTLTVRLQEEPAAQIEAESRARKVSNSDIVRYRLISAQPQPATSLDDIADLIGSVTGLPVDLSQNKKKYLKAGYGLKRSR